MDHLVVGIDRKTKHVHAKRSDTDANDSGIDKDPKYCKENQDNNAAVAGSDAINDSSSKGGTSSYSSYHPDEGLRMQILIELIRAHVFTVCQTQQQQQRVQEALGVGSPR